MAANPFEHLNFGDVPDRNIFDAKVKMDDPEFNRTKPGRFKGHLKDIRVYDLETTMHGLGTMQMSYKFNNMLYKKVSDTEAIENIAYRFLGLVKAPTELMDTMFELSADNKSALLIFIAVVSYIALDYPNLKDRLITETLQDMVSKWIC